MCFWIFFPNFLLDFWNLFLSMFKSSFLELISFLKKSLAIPNAISIYTHIKTYILEKNNYNNLII